MENDTVANVLRVHLVHSRLLFRESLSGALNAEPGITVVGDSGSLADAVHALEVVPADVLLVDLAMAAFTEADFAACGKPLPRLLAIAEDAEAPEVLAALNLGFAGIFFNDGGTHSLAQAVRVVASGSAWLDRRVITVLAESGTRSWRREEGFPDSLSLREQEIVAGVCEGLTNHEIASRLGVSESAVKNALRLLFRKAGAHTRTQLVRVYMESKKAGRPAASGLMVGK